MEEEKGGDAEGANEVWVLNWVKEMWMEMGCFQRRGEEGGRVWASCFSLKGRGGEESEGIIPTFSPGLHTCDPAASRPSYFSHECVFIFFSLFFCAMCVSLSGSRTPLYDWWASVRPGSLPRPRPDQACSGHNNAINMWLTAVPAYVCVCVCVCACVCVCV